MMIVRGVNVFPSQIEELILRFPALAPHYPIELSKAGHMDAVLLRIERAPGAKKETGTAQARDLEAQIKALIGISCGTLLCDEGGIPRSEGKAKRVVDRR